MSMPPYKAQCIFVLIISKDWKDTVSALTSQSLRPPNQKEKAKGGISHKWKILHMFGIFWMI